MSLTPRRKQLLDYIRRYTSKHSYAPTLKEMAKYMGVKVPTIYSYLNALARDGYISKRAFHHRSISVVGDQEQPRKDGAPSEVVRRLEVEKNIWKSLYLAGLGPTEKAEIERAVLARVRDIQPLRCQNDTLE